jgi:hypothetical protein
MYANCVPSKKISIYLIGYAKTVGRECTMQTEQDERREVYIEVLGGVAHIVSAPDDVDVYIIDLDEEKESAR